MKTFGCSSRRLFCCSSSIQAADAATIKRLNGGIIMKVLKTMMWTSMSIAALGVLGCDVYVNGHSHEQPAYAQQQPQYAEPQPQYVVVQQAPPPMIVESR